MTKAEMQKRIEELERQVAELQANRVVHYHYYQQPFQWPANPQQPYWREWVTSTTSANGAHSHDIVNNMIQTAEDAGADPALLF